MSSISDKNPNALMGSEIKDEAGAAILDTQKGKNTTRVKFACLDNADSKFFFSTMHDTFNPFKLIHRWRRYVPIKIKQGSTEKIVYVNVGSLAKRLLFTEKQIWEAAKNKSLETMISSRSLYIQKENQQILKDFSYGSNLSLRWKATGEKVQFTVNTVFEVFKQSIKVERPVPVKVTAVEQRDKKQYSIEVSTNDKTTVYKRHSEIARGTFGIVYKVEDVATQTFAAMKVSRTLSTHKQDEGDEDIIESFETEQDIVPYVNRFGTHPNVQRTHINVFTVDLGSSKSLYQLSELYQGKTLTEWNTDPELKPEVRLSVAKKIFEGFHYLSRVAKVGHGDIKPDNIRFDAEGNPIILDFGGSCKLERDRIELFRGISINSPIFLDKKTDEALGVKIQAHNQKVVIFYELVSQTLKLKKKIDGLPDIPENKAKIEQLTLKYHQQLVDVETIGAEIEDLYKEICRLTRYLDFFAMFRTLIEIFTGKANTKDKLVGPEEIDKLPEDVKQFIYKLAGIGENNFTDEMIDELNKELAQIKDL